MPWKTPAPPPHRWHWPDGVLQRSPFCSQCSAELATALEASLPKIPDSVHLKLISTGKPDARLRTTKALRVR